MYRKLYLKDSEIKTNINIVDVTKLTFNEKVAVSITHVYMQVTKFCSRTDKSREIEILKKILIDYESKGYVVDPNYVVMNALDFVTCFPEKIKHPPKRNLLEKRKRKINMKKQSISPQTAQIVKNKTYL